MSGGQLMKKLIAADSVRSEVFVALPHGAAEQARVITNQFDNLAVLINAGTNILILLELLPILRPVTFDAQRQLSLVNP